VSVSIAENLMNKVDKLIQIIHNLKEEGGVVSGGPTNSLSGGKIAGTSQAGDSPPVDLRKHRSWNPFFKNLARMQRRKPQ